MQYSYDGFGRVVQSRQTTPLGGQPPYLFSNYSYSLTDQLTGMTYPSGRAVTYTLDAADEATGLSGAFAGGTTPYASGIQYMAAGGVTSLPMGNGITESRTWNNLMEQTSVSAGSLSLGYNYCNNGTSQCTSGNTGSPFQQTIGWGGQTQAVQQFTPDGVNRITSASEQQGSSTIWSRQYSYDNLGNMTQTPPPGGGTTWTASSFNSKNQVAGQNWVYDNAGNVVGAGTGGPMLQYDGESRLVNVCGNSSCTTFSYDAAGNRVQRTDSSSQSSTTTTFVYDAFGNLAADYGAPANAPGTQYVAVDAMGSTRLVMDGSAVERHDFEPYGAELSGGWRTPALGYGSATVRQRFTGQERDDETTLDYFMARYYSGTQGRFGSPDPGNAGANPGDPQSWNGYAYVSGNPLMYTDPSGLQAGGGGDMAGGGGGDSGIAGAIVTAFADALGFLIGGGGSNPNLSSIAWTPTPSAFDTSPALLSWTWFSPYSVTSINLSFGNSLLAGTLDDVALDSWQFHAVALGAQHAKKTVDYAGVGTAAVLALPAVVADGAPAVGAVAARGAATAVGWAYGLTGGSGVVLGTYYNVATEEGAGPNYINGARAMGANAYNIRGWLWSALSYTGQTWTANQSFIDASIWRGQQFYLSTAPLGATGSFAQELEYLAARGIGPGQLQMVRLPYPW